MGFSGKALTQMKSLLLCGSWGFTKSSSCPSLHPQESLSQDAAFIFPQLVPERDFYNCIGRALCTESLFCGLGLGEVGRGTVSLAALDWAVGLRVSSSFNTDFLFFCFLNENI